jgi:hypothetical protein
MKTTDVIDHLREGLDALLAQRPRVEAAAPFPQSDNILHNVPEAHWYPPEVLAHLTEMLPFWFGEVERIMAGDGSEPVPFGRVADNELRIGVIDRDRTLPLRELYARVESIVNRAIARLGEMTDGDLDRTGLRQGRGVVTIGQIMDNSMAGHLMEHVRQIDDLLGDTTQATAG